MKKKDLVFEKRSKKRVEPKYGVTAELSPDMVDIRRGVLTPSEENVERARNWSIEKKL